MSLVEYLCMSSQHTEPVRYDGDTANGKIANNQLVYVSSGDNSAKVKPRVRHAHGGADLMLRAARASVLGIAT